MKFTIDSNVFVDAVRSPQRLDDLLQFLQWSRELVEISSVVVAELEAGARTRLTREWLDDHLLASFERRGRIVAPTRQEWRKAGRLMSETPTGSPYAARQNDLLLATQARERGWMVITRDRDFTELRSSVPGLQVMAPFPPLPRT